MHWLAIIVITTNIGGTQYMHLIPSESQVACEIEVAAYVGTYNGAPVKYFYECVDINALEVTK